jgi:hypothetical protein
MDKVYVEIVRQRGAQRALFVLNGEVENMRLKLRVKRNDQVTFLPSGLLGAQFQDVLVEDE